MLHRSNLSRRAFLGAGGALFGFAAGLTPQPAGAAAQLFGTTREKAAAAVKDMLQKPGIPSVSYALVWRNGLVWADAAGLIDPLAGKPPGPETLYGIGSCSKVIATVAMMRLIDKGRAKLDDPLVKHVPAFRMLSPEYKDVTLRMLMNHSCGFPGTEYRGAITTAWHAEYADAVLATLAQSRLKHRPGEMSVYCNDGFTMLELVIRALSGMSYPAFVRQEILTPLGMARSGYGDVDVAPGGFAPGVNDGRLLPREIASCAASGGLVTTPTELARFLAVFLNEGRFEGADVLSAGAIDAMGENQTAQQPFAPLGGIDGYGLGWDSVSPPAFEALGVKAWRKNGGTAVYSTDMIVLPDAGLAVAVTAAAPGAGTGALAELILFSALMEQGTLTDMPRPLASTPLVAASQPVGGEWFDGAFGTYEQVFRFVPDGAGGATQVKAAGGQWKTHLEKLQLRKDGRLGSDAMKDVGLALRDYEGVTFLTAHAPLGYKTQAFEMMAAQKLTPLGDMRPAWKARLGRSFVLVNAPADVYLPGMSAMTVRLDAYPELPGYVVIGGDFNSTGGNQPVDATRDDFRGLMCLKIPVSPGRDLNDLVVIPRGREEWLQYGSWLARPVDEIPQIGQGAHDLAIGFDGSAEWLGLARSGWLDIAGASDWMLFGDDFAFLAAGRGTVTDLASIDAAYLLVYGPPGGKVSVKMS